MNLTEAIAHFTLAAANTRAVEEALIARMCKVVCDEAKRVLGSYDYNWPSLKPETIARKMTGDSPLLESGAMRDSIGFVTSGLTGIVGSNDDNAVYNELGTMHIPPRPFLAGAAQAKLSDGTIAALAVRAVRALMLGRRSELAEFIEILRLYKKS